MALPFFEETGIHFPPPLLLPYTGVAYLSIPPPLSLSLLSLSTILLVVPIPYEAREKASMGLDIRRFIRLHYPEFPFLFVETGNTAFPAVEVIQLVAANPLIGGYQNDSLSFEYCHSPR